VGYTRGNAMTTSLNLVLFIVCTAVVLPVWCSRSILVCPNLTVEPTISELVTGLVGNETAAQVKGTLESQGISTSSLSFLDSVLKWSLPVTSLFSYGRFTVTYSQPRLFTFNDISIVHKRNRFIDLACSNSFVNDRLSFLCDCDGGVLAVDQGEGTQCIKSGLCSDKTLVEGKCVIPWNPFDKGCLMINVRSDLDVTEESAVQNSVEYKRVTPTVYDVWVAVMGFTNPFSTASSSHTVLAEAFDAYVVPMLQYIPLYAVNLVLGYAVVTNARDLIEYGSARMLLQVVYGLFLAFIVLAYMLYRYGMLLLLLLTARHLTAEFGQLTV
jgi:hypothetical protein